ncbi:uncharacterized protein LOC143076795 [Mytilus galloprovincialis]|uniref:uncharacterized protein LOC143076795 n=1 Tax=Mytilus galloprovincialis TaxID=29158 RepID=UPI003F7B82D2
MTERLQLNVEKPREDLDLITVPDDREQLQLEKNISISQKHRFGIQKITAGDEKRLEKYLEPNSPACCKEKEKKHDTDRSVSGWFGICFSVAEPFKIFVGLNAGQDSFTVAKPTDAPLSLNQEQDTTSTTKDAPLVLNPDQDKIKGVEHSDGSRSLCPEQAALKVAEHSDGCLSIDHQQHQIKETYYKHGNRVRKDIYFRINRISVPIYLSSLVMIALCFFPDTSAFKVESGYTIFENLWGKSARYPPISKSVIEQNAAKVQAHGKPQQAGRNDGREQQTEENRKKREVEEAESREKQEEQQKLSRKRRMVASPAFPLDTTKDNYEIVTPIIMKNGTLLIKFQHSEGQLDCRVELGTHQYSSKERQVGNIIIERSERLCIFHIKQFTMEQYVNATFTLDYHLHRIVETTLFWNILINRVATYDPNDKSGIVTILTIGENIQCYLQPPNIVNNKSEERGNIVTKSIFHYEKAQICLYNISCSMRGSFTSIIKEIEMCKVVPTVSTLPTVPTMVTILPSYSGDTGYTATITDNYVYTTTTPSNSTSRSESLDPKAIAIPIFIVIVIICLFVYLFLKRDKLKQWYIKRYESQDIEKGQEEIEMNVTKPDGVTISKTVTNKPLLQGRSSNLFETRV